IRNSLEKPVYKEKLRLRCYGSPKPQDPVFVELKKKYMGTVYKRRVALSLQAAESYLYQRLPPEVDSQVLREVDYMYSFYHTLIPTAYIAYQRVALYGLEDANLRVTFDWNLRWRCENLHLDAGTEGQLLLPEGQFLMEIKVPCAMPVWMARLLDTLQIFPTSFSKYGVAYQNSMAHGAINRNVEISMENGDKKGRIVYA
ncbi:MAG: VTC domain-containing protein, partial [Faecalispora jeddahensis]